jgi:prepilin-type N-terminal cleavage/methylation domain-containing protein
MDQGLIERERVRSQLGFTLIEMMITVAVIAVLALIVVPQFFKESRKTKSASEIAPMFAELSIREEQYKVDNTGYLSTITCPATPSAQGNPTTTCEAQADWIALKVAPSETKLFCSYTVTAGAGAGTTVAAFGWTSPAGSWYYIEATCDMDGNTATDSMYFTSSSNTEIKKLNEGF